MKNLVMIVHANMQQDLADQLRSLTQVQGFTFCHVEGHGTRVEHDPFLSARDKVVGYVPRVRVDILLHETDVEMILAAIRDRESGQGVYWVTAVEEYGQL